MCREAYVVLQSPEWQKGLKAAGVIVFRGGYARGIGRLCLDAKHPLLFKVPNSGILHMLSLARGPPCWVSRGTSGVVV